MLIILFIEPLREQNLRIFSVMLTLDPFQDTILQISLISLDRLAENILLPLLVLYKYCTF